MLLIADSGSTKTDWLILQPDGTYESMQSQGLNPYMVLAEDFKYVVRKTLNDHLLDISEVKFYGAGCSEEMIPVVRQYLKEIFIAAKIDVYSDLVAAAHATLGHNEGITAILGTGSNSGYFNGKEFVKKVPSLGFILGDEGSGTYMGKALLRDYMRDNLPEELKVKFEENYKITLSSVLNKLYNQGSANTYLAGYTFFLQENIEHPYCHKLVKNSLVKFIKHSLLKYENVSNVRIGFVGSLATIFKDILEECLLEHDIIDITISRSPLEGLKEYYRNDQETRETAY